MKFGFMQDYMNAARVQNFFSFPEPFVGAVHVVAAPAAAQQPPKPGGRIFPTSLRKTGKPAAENRKPRSIKPSKLGGVYFLSRIATSARPVEHAHKKFEYLPVKAWLPPVFSVPPPSGDRCQAQKIPWMGYGPGWGGGGEVTENVSDLNGYAASTNFSERISFSLCLRHDPRTSVPLHGGADTASVTSGADRVARKLKAKMRKWSVCGAPAAAESLATVICR